MTKEAVMGKTIELGVAKVFPFKVLNISFWPGSELPNNPIPHLHTFCPRLVEG